jgi:cell division protein FtsL
MNVVRHQPRVALGPVSHTIVVALLVLVVGLIYVSAGSKTTSYDYDMQRIDKEIAELSAAKDDLAIENARLTSAAAAEKSEVAANMVEARVGGYVRE